MCSERHRLFRPLVYKDYINLEVCGPFAGHSDGGEKLEKSFEENLNKPKWKSLGRLKKHTEGTQKPLARDTAKGTARAWKAREPPDHHQLISETQRDQSTESNKP